ncbi:TPA: hypothetical protein N0F65_001962 [Lagenidium giganteum]|uniref:Uncharacterized protein n=1 Tax=Lagenidium giganteum TaxID=4803 RepID=A0AAV2YKF9_9STRA|nr:TPA: hypothetical protein N0F65_001962 [Lagenidium giganteum]
MEPPPINPKKVNDMYANVYKYVPKEFQGDALYAPPSKAQIVEAIGRKKARADARAKAKEAKSG